MLHAASPSPWPSSPAQHPEVDHALVESSLAKGEGGRWGLVVRLKRDQKGTGLPKVHYSLQPDRLLTDAELRQLERTGAGTNTTAGVMGGSLRQPRDRHLRAGTGVRSSGLDVEGQGAGHCTTPQLMLRARCMRTAAASPEQGLSTTCQAAVTGCHQPKPLEAGTRKQSPSCWRQCPQQSCLASPSSLTRDEHRGWF